MEERLPGGVILVGRDLDVEWAQDLEAGGGRERLPDALGTVLQDGEAREAVADDDLAGGARAADLRKDFATQDAAALDRALTDLAGFYRDVLVVQLGATVDIANVDEESAITTLAAASSAEATLRRLSSVLACRTSLDANANPLLTVEALTLALRAG